jgi:hypothetical protein
MVESCLFFNPRITHKFLKFKHLDTYYAQVGGPHLFPLMLTINILLPIMVCNELQKCFSCAK